MKNKNLVIKMNPAGELEMPFIHDYKNRYKVDSPFFYEPVSYILMIACIVVDLALFYSLFVRVSFDNPIMIYLQCAGLAFAADIVPAYAGILYKRIQQGLSKEKMNLYLLLAVPVFALIINGILRMSTMSLTNIDGIIDETTIALTIIGIVFPVLTSLGNFSISALTYDPLAKKLYEEEVALNDIRDQRRRLQALMSDYRYDEHCSERLSDMDLKHLTNAKKEWISEVLDVYNDGQILLMETFADPTSTNVLSKSQCEEIFERLERELEALDRVCCDMKIKEDEHKKKLIIFSDVA